MDEFRPYWTALHERARNSVRPSGDTPSPRFSPEPPSLACSTPQGRAAAAEGRSASSWWARASAVLERVAPWLFEPVPHDQLHLYVKQPSPRPQSSVSRPARSGLGGSRANATADACRTCGQTPPLTAIAEQSATRRMLAPPNRSSTSRVVPMRHRHALYLSEAMTQRLQITAETHRVSKSEILERALQRFLAADSGGQPSELLALQQETNSDRCAASSATSPSPRSCWRHSCATS